MTYNLRKIYNGYVCTVSDYSYDFPYEVMTFYAVDFQSAVEMAMKYQEKLVKSDICKKIY